ncbi:MAG: hypothetical protein JW922_03045 [Paludibacteraceae bacterium]|nr:hypothetical protein [Paludibacteraceae bacterium]
MKFIRLSKLVAGTIAASMLLFTSCMDEDINMDNLSNVMRFDGNLAAPLGEVTVTVKDILDSVETNSNITISEQGGCVNVYFSDTLEYTNPANNNLNSFGKIHKLLTPGTTTGLPAEIPAGEITYTVTETYDFNDINTDLAKQRVDSIRFFNTTITATVITTLPAGFLRVEIELPPEFEGEGGEVVKMDLTGATTTQDFESENFVVRTENGKLSSTFPIKIIAHGDGSTPLTGSDSISINIELNAVKYVAHGYFNTGQDLLPQNEGLELDLYSLLPNGSLVYPANPEFIFDITSNLGVPMLFNIKGLKTFATGTTPADSVAATFNGDITETFNINAATSYTHDATYNTTGEQSSNITLNKDVDKGKINELFKIKVDSAAAKFSFGTQDLDPSTSGQFITWDSKVKVKVGINMPFWLDEGSTIQSTDTIKDVGETLSNLLDEDNITEAVIRIKTTNMLPMGVKTYLRFLDENYLPVSTLNLYEYTIPAGVVNSEGLTTSASSNTFKITINASQIEDLKKTKHIKMTTIAEGYSTSSKMKFRMSDWLKIQVGAYVIGGVTSNK